MKKKLDLTNVKKQPNLAQIIALLKLAFNKMDIEEEESKIPNNIKKFFKEK